MASQSCRGKPSSFERILCGAKRARKGCTLKPGQEDGSAIPRFEMVGVGRLFEVRHSMKQGLSTD